VNHYHTAIQRSRLLIRSLARLCPRADEMNLSHELLRPVVREGS
jgi:hypothetical protein